MRIAQLPPPSIIMFFSILFFFFKTRPSRFASTTTTSTFYYCQLTVQIDRLSYAIRARALTHNSSPGVIIVMIRLIKVMIASGRLVVVVVVI